jgi:serine O-acetyltransferase
VSFLKWVIIDPGFKYTFFMRTAKFLKEKGWTTLVPYAFVRVVLRHLKYKYGISIPYNADIGPGLYIGHFGGIVVSYEARIGRNCNLNHCVTIGATYGGKCPGVPLIMNNVYLGPGSKVVGGITVGNDVAVGANCVVAQSVPDNGVVVGVPGRIVSYKGSTNYVKNRVSEWSDVQSDRCAGKK